MVKWVNTTAELSVQPDDNVLNWLTKPYVLSQALKTLCQKFTVRILFQGVQSATEDETHSLAIPSDELPFIREVVLEGDDCPYTYGRVVIPQKTFEAYREDFGSLGDKPIGETLLYQYPHMVRSGFEYGYFSSDEPLLQGLYARLDETMSAPVWGRRSVFRLADHPLMVSELFLPTLPNYPAS